MNSLEDLALEAINRYMQASAPQPIEFYYYDHATNITNSNSVASRCSVQLVDGDDVRNVTWGLVVCVTIGDRKLARHLANVEMQRLRPTPADVISELYPIIEGCVLGAIEEAIELYEAQSAHKETT